MSIVYYLYPFGPIVIISWRSILDEIDLTRNKLKILILYIYEHDKHMWIIRGSVSALVPEMTVSGLIVGVGGSTPRWL